MLHLRLVVEAEDPAAPVIHRPAVVLLIAAPATLHLPGAGDPALRPGQLLGVLHTRVVIAGRKLHVQPGSELAVSHLHTMHQGGLRDDGPRTLHCHRDHLVSQPGARWAASTAARTASS